ncbi:substrate-binding domain-containing protein [Tropicimonas sp. IMCC6043]|uniref:vWA domain-containing protein n=1 Tax=Tropicimonas sp. IMCC6043 TaxID=2510645 RepID=UPI00101BB8AB|nr:substrate-binding domain-containing protein [Tropicimonas sp. IMCC6043]RYH11163.1 VWA domain-containing protein [Tropicimonas sp. IMCC6043]
MSGKATARKKAALLIAIVALVAFVILGQIPGGPRTQLSIVSGSENEGLEPIIAEWAEKNRVDATVTYLGSVDISREISKGAETDFDAVWPANSLWIELGDTQKVVKHRESILRSPVVLGLKRPIAEKLGWVGRDDITIQMIQEAATAGAFRLAMTSATQSNSGASAYNGFLYALSGDPDLLTMEDLEDPEVQAGVKSLLAQVDRSSGSSGWLKESLVENPAAYDAMINYEAMVLEANLALETAGQEPLYIVYPANGLSVADSPLGMIDKGDPDKEEAFLALQKHLLSPETQESLVAAGRRAGLIGLSASANDEIWNPAWGADPDRAIAPVPTPSTEVIAEALRLYQTELRKPSLTVWVLDVSGSMEGEPLAQLKQAMGLLLDPAAAAVNLLQPSSRDVTIIIPFNHETQKPTVVEGGESTDLAAALQRVNTLEAGGGTDLYYAIFQAFETLKPYNEAGTLFDYLPAIVAMTDGASDVINREPLLSYMNDLGFGRDVPIHAISFGAADEAQLKELNQETVGRLFNAGSDLAKALRSAKGYN